MDFLDSLDDNSKILLVTGGGSDITSVLEGAFEFVITDGTDKAMAILDEWYRDILAVLVDSAIAYKDDYALLKGIRADRRYVYIPVLVLTDREPDKDDAAALKYGAVDYITPPICRGIAINRINNAVRIKDSATYFELEQILKQLPSNIYLKDADGRYVFATRKRHHMERGETPKKWSVRGKTDVEIRPEKDNALLAMKKDKELMASGKGQQYIIESNVDGMREFYEIIKEPLYDRDGNVTGIVGLINDVTEHEVLKEKLRRASTIDGLTGLFNRKEIQSQIERRLNDIRNDTFSLIMLDIDDFKMVNDTYGHKEGDNVIIKLSDILNDKVASCEEKYSAGRWGGEEFMMLLSGTDVYEAAEIAEQIRANFEKAVFPNACSRTVSLGVTQAFESDSADSLCVRVDNALYTAKKEGKNRVVVV